MGSFVAVGRHAERQITINAPPAPDSPDHPPTGFSATELLLAGAGSCAAWDVIEILHKRRASLAELEVTVEGQQAADPPWHYERVVLHFRVRAADVSAGVLERVIRLSVARYCSVLATVRGVARVEATLELVGADGTSGGRQPVRLDVEVAEPFDEPVSDE